jgi:hypothetical protein
MKKRLAAALAVVAIGVGVGAPAASAQPVIVSNGLVDVTVNNVLNNNEVAIPIAASVAANVCGTQVQVGVLAQQLARNGSFSCTNPNNGSTATVTQ